MNKKIQRMAEEVKRRGGMVHLGKDLPDAVAEQFLKEVLACPDCCAASGEFSPGGVTIDYVLAGRTSKCDCDH